MTPENLALHPSRVCAAACAGRIQALPNASTSCAANSPTCNLKSTAATPSNPPPARTKSAPIFQFYLQAEAEVKSRARSFRVTLLPVCSTLCHVERLTRSEAARVAGCSTRTIARAIQRGAIGGKLQGRELLLDAADVKAFRLSRERTGDPLAPLREFISDLLERESANAE